MAASSVQRGTSFSLTVALSTTPKISIKPKQREQIFEYIKSQLPLYQKNLHTIEEIDYFDVISITKGSDNLIKLELSVYDEDGLEKLFKYSRQQQKDKKNGLSHSLTTFFHNLDFQRSFGFSLGTKINIIVNMAEKERKKIAEELAKKAERKDKSEGNHGNSRNEAIHSPGTGPSQVRTMIKQFDRTSSKDTSIAFDGSEQGNNILMTFIIDVPENKEVISAKIQSRSIPELNCEMFRSKRNIYSIDVDLSAEYDPHALYSYEITFKDSVLILFETTKVVTTSHFTLGDKTIHRDLLWDRDSILSHLLDLVHSVTDRFSETEICMQIEDICKLVRFHDLEFTVRTLLNSGILHSHRYLLRFALVIGNLCKDYSSPMYHTVDATTAHEILDALLQKRLSNFPVSCSVYMPKLCKHLSKIAYDKDFCILIFLNRVSSFMSKDLVLQALKDLISSRDKFLNNNPYCDKLAMDLCTSFFTEYTRTGNQALKEIVEILFRHLPLEMTLPCYGRLTELHENDNDEGIQREEDALVAVTASIKSQILCFINKELKEKKVISLLKMASMLGSFELTNDKNVQTNIEDGVLNCFSWHSLKETEIGQEILEFLHFSGCFVNLESQLSLLKSISESRSPAVRKLFIVLNEEQLLTEAYGYLDVDVYVSWLQNEIRTSQTRSANEIVVTFRALCEISKLTTVSEREEIRQALDLVTLNSLKRYTLKEMVQNLEKIENLYDKEPAVLQLYKTQVQELLNAKGLTPTEVLMLFCTNGYLRINSKTTGDIVCTIINLFFERSSHDLAFDIFINQIPHVDFWELIANGGGLRINDVKNNSIYQHVVSSIQQVTYLLRHHEVDISFMSKLNLKDDKTKRTLQLGGMQKKEIEAMLINFKKELEKVTQTTMCVITVLEAVEGRRSDLIPELSLLLEKTESLKSKIENGSMFIKEAVSVRWLWGDLSELPEICIALHPVIKSNVFWNVAGEAVSASFTSSLQTFVPLNGLVSIRYLFHAEPVDEYQQDIEKIEETLLFLKLLKNEGLELFKKHWTELETDKAIPLQSVQEMFEKAHVLDEIMIAETFFQRSIKYTVKQTLTQLWRKNEVLETAKAMTSVLEAFGYKITEDNEVCSALKSFQELIAQTISEFTLHEVQLALQTIFSLADTLTDETVSIMMEIGKSSLLVEFLREIAIEDVRNLIDAVEDISESHVQESTVSALIETKRFLLPLLTPTDLNVKGSRWIFQTLQKQTSALGKNAGSIPGKISDCSLNLHNLKSLYNNVANRGQQTKEVIKSIITKGKFAFMLGIDQDRVVFDVTYKENKNKFTKLEATVLDIRSRALLLLNTERQCTESSFNQEEFRIFIESVDLCLEIRDTLGDLFSSGHISYKSFRLSLGCLELHQTKDSLKAELDEWTKNMRHARNNYYLMNFIQGCQIHIISEFLQNGIGKDAVEAILKYIHPHLAVSELSATYNADLCLHDKDFMLGELGRTLHKMYSNLNLFKRDMKCEDFTTKITECVHKGKLLVAQLDEKSEFVVRTALALYRNTTQQFPEPNQLLFCSRDTTWSEIDLLLQRCKGSYCFYGSLPLFCLANVEMLQNEVQFRLVEELQNLKGFSDFLLTIICRGSKNHPFVDQLNDNVVTIQPVSDQAIENLLHTHHPNVFTYTSEVAGLGKTTNISKKSVSSDRSTVTIHVSGQFRKSNLIANLNRIKVQNFHTLHFDIGVVDEPGELDTFLFELVVMRFVSSGELAFYMPTYHVCFEIGNTINNSLRNNLTTVTSFKREHLLWSNFSDFICSQEINSPVQVVCQYLNVLKKGMLDREELYFSGKKAQKALSAEDCRILLRKHMDIASDISYSVVHIFLNVLCDQLKKLSCSSFFKVSRISEMIGQSTVPTVRSNLVRAMIDVSMEFASRSVNACRSTQSSTLGSDLTSIQTVKTGNELVDKVIHRVDGMIRWEESNHLIYVFHNQNIHTLSPMYRDRNKVPEHVRKLFESQMKRPLPDFTAMKQIELQNMLQRVARTNPASLSEKQLTDLSKDYALTPDNLLKMVLIMMRIQSKVPVLVMGETGCGKTSLIRYLACICEVPFRVLNVHAGVHTSEILDTVMQENGKCIGNLGVQRWLFLDEINTSENVGLICDIICHHRCVGSVLSPNLVIMGACNPYKLRTIDAIHTAGLTGKVKTDELSKLVYRVLPLPEMMVDYVWDFGSLSETDELKYIQRMIEGVFLFGSREHVLFSDLLSISQTFVRDTELSTCAVSLRDVQRCKTLIPWFLEIFKIKTVKKYSLNHLQLNTEVKAIVLALAHCYHSRFMDKSVRKSYREKLLEGFKRNNFTSLTSESDIHDMIKAEQRDILDRMDLPHGTAKNTALQENVFVILVCILNKIPIFVVGKPGCSKSLAMQVIRSNLRGKDSKDAFFKTLPQLYCVSFQGSESSTSDGIIKVFEKAENYQKSNSKDSVLSVVILDEIGLAEISRFNPLKVLHNLLEPEGRSRPNIAVVGISNWALDASKMNRAVHLSRPDMDEDELFETALSISNSFIENIQVHEGLSWSETEKKNTLSLKDIEHELRLVAKSYTSYTKKLQFKNFHGLRDFYSLVKFIARNLAEDFKNLTSQKKSAVIMEGLLRNFGGLKLGRKDLLDHFKGCFQTNVKTSFSSIELIGSNICDTIARHLMVITKGDSVFGIIEQHLRESGRERKEIIFGSQFEEDLTDDYNYRILSRIILCMEQGIVLVLKDLENIYGSLYDMLNQNYTRIGKKNNCRVALGPYSNPFCHVADSFRCIVLVDESKVDYADPPFLNRFEKQFLTYADVLSNEESNLVNELNNWIESITTIEGKPFSKDSALPYYNEELIISLIMFYKKQNTQSGVSLLEECKAEILWILRPEVIVRLSKVDDISIQQSSEQMKNCYFQLPLHDGLGNLIAYHINDDKNEHLTVVFTNSNIHTKISQELNKWHCQFEKLGAFKSEKQLSVKLQQFWNNPDMQILLVHCNAQEDDRHIMLTKSLIEKYRAEYLEKSSIQNYKMVYLIVHLGCRDISELAVESFVSLSQINYLSGWKLLLLENLERPKTSLPEFCSKSLLDTIQDTLAMTDCLKEDLFWAFTRIQYGVHGRDTESIKSVIDMVSNSDTFLRTLSKMVWSYVRESNTGQDDIGWFVNVACDPQALYTSAFLIDALERQIQRIIKIPLAKVIYKLEHLGAIDSYFVEDTYSAERREVWCANIENEKIFSYNIEDKPIKDPTGPECYHCDTPDLGLKLPFSKVIFESIEETKVLFTDEVTRSKLKCDLDNDDNLPEEIMSEIILQQESFILKRLSDILETNGTFELLIRDYVSDFCNLYSYTLSSVLDRDTRIKYMKWTIEQMVHLESNDSIQLFTSIHCAGWSHTSVFGSVIQLLELCHAVCTGENANVLELFQQAIEATNEGTDGQLCENKMITPSSSFQQSEDELEAELLHQSDNSVFTSDEANSEKKQTTDELAPSFIVANSDIYNFAFDADLNEVDEKTQEKELFSNNTSTESGDSSNQGVESLSHTADKAEVKGVDKEFMEANTEVMLDTGSEEGSPKTSQETDFCLQNPNDMLKEQKCDENLETGVTEFMVEINTEVVENVQSVTEKTGAVNESKEETKISLSGDSIQDLVSFVCSRMIPTKDNFCQFSGLKHWQVTVRNILIVAAEVSTESEPLHALRLCNDIVTDLVIPYKLQIISLQNIGGSLRSGNVDSEEVFSALLGIFHHVKATQSSASVQRIICQFLIRCLSVNTETTAFTYLFNAIEENSIPEDNMQLLKAPLSFLLQQELAENENLFRELLEDSNESNENGNHIKDSSVFLTALDNCIQSLFIQGRIESSFVLLILDLLQETFETDDDVENRYELMLTSGKVLQDNNISLTSITAVAYLKAAISYISYCISEPDTTSLLEDLNAVFTGLSDNPLHRSLLEYFLKCLGKNFAVSTIMKRCSSISAEYPFVGSLVWTDGYLSKTLEGNPLALDLPLELLHEGEKYIAAEQTTESYRTSIVSLIKLSSKESVFGPLLLYSLAIKDFYLPRYRGMLNDIEKSHAAIFLEQYKQCQYSPEQMILMECILGKRDFKCSLFMHGEESSFQQYMVNSILVSCFARSLCYGKETSGQPASYLKRCLLRPKDLKSCFLPGFPDMTDSYLFQNSTTVPGKGLVFSVCGCNKRLLYRMPESKLVCVACRKEIPAENIEVNKQLKTSHPVQASPGFTFKSHIVGKEISVRKLSEVSLNALNLLVKGCLLGSFALKISSSVEFEELIAETSKGDINTQLESEIYHHWNNLKKLLNMDDHDVGIILHSILHAGRQVLFEERNALVTCAHRDLWEAKFESVVSELLENRIHTIQHSIVSCNSIYNLPEDSVEVVIREANVLKALEKETQHDRLSSLFKISVKPSKTDFLCQLWPHKEKFEFLTSFLKHESQLLLPKHIYQILQWHMMTVLNISYSFKRYDCLKLTVREFHDSISDLNKRKMSKKKFENFKTSWNFVKKALESNEGFETLLPMNFETKMADCLILDTACGIYKVLSFLISTQNNFIDEALQLSFTCKSLQFLLRDTDIACFKTVPVTEIEKENLIDVSFNWEENLAQESNSGLGYGLGKQVLYDFCNIEKELSVELLVGKAYINLDALPNIVFTDELYKNFVGLLADVHHCIPQESLPSDIEVAFVKANKDMANMSLELINYLDMIMTLLKKTKCDTQKPLTEFIKERINILGLRFPSQYLPSPENRVKICHVVSLHELLEELSVDRIIGTLGDTYGMDLEASMEDHFTKMPAASIRKSEYVLKAIKRFIYRCIYMGDTDPEQPLLQFLSQKSFWPVSIFCDGRLKVDGKEEDIKEIIPPEVRVCFVVSVVSQLNESIETQKQGELRMDRVITGWKDRGGDKSTKVTRQKKAVKKLRKS